MGRSSTILSVSFQTSTIIRSEIMEAVDQLGEFIEVMGTENQVDETIALLDLLHHLRLLHHTAAEGDHHIRVVLFLMTHEAKMAVNLEICVFPDRTGVVNDKVRFLTPQ